MSRRFQPPPLSRFYAAPEVDHARAIAAARADGIAEGSSQGHKQGYEAGFAEGTAEARAALQPELDALRETSANRERRIGVADALRQLLAARQADLASVEQASREVTAAVLEALFPTLVATVAGQEVTHLLADALAERAPEVLILRAHPDTLAVIAAETVAEQASGRLTLEAAPDMAFAAAEAVWSGGGITFDPAALLARITSVLRGFTPAEPSLEAL